jgi:hypothetical protein
VRGEPIYGSSAERRADRVLRSDPSSLARAVISWSPALAAIILMNALMPVRVDEMRLDHALPVVALLLVFIAGAIASFLNPQSGVQDRLACTKVVAR